MPRPSFVTNEDLLRWSEIIDKDPLIPSSIAQNAIIREVCYAGQWLSEKLTELDCPDHLVGQMMYTAGRICFGRKDPWDIHQEMLRQFIDGTLEFEMDPNEMN
jgi:hypothetical protein